MSQWQSIQFENMMEDTEAALRIQAAYTPLHAAAGLPADMAVFAHYDVMARKAIYYFSPGASALAKKFGATVCDKPVRDAPLSLLAGSASAWEIYYPSP